MCGRRLCSKLLMRPLMNCYNAKAHFNLSAPNELLISYNTITPNFWIDIKEDAHIYRPRFIKIKFDL